MKQFSMKLLKKLISIPSGAIKRMKQFSMKLLKKLISIPSGAIKRK